MDREKRAEKGEGRNGEMVMKKEFKVWWTIIILLVCFIWIVKPKLGVTELFIRIIK